MSTMRVPIVDLRAQHAPLSEESSAIRDAPPTPLRIAGASIIIGAIRRFRALRGVNTA